jgi:hypothetical protein
MLYCDVWCGKQGTGERGFIVSNPHRSPPGLTNKPLIVVSYAIFRRFAAKFYHPVTFTH